MPNKSERLSGRPVLKAFLELFPCDQIVALGKIAAAQLEELMLTPIAFAIRLPAGQDFFASKSPDREQIEPVIGRACLSERFTRSAFAENSAINKKAASDNSEAALTLFC